MQVTQQKNKFKPITIILEKHEELIDLKDALRQADIYAGLREYAEELFEKLDLL